MFMFENFVIYFLIYIPVDLVITLKGLYHKVIIRNLVKDLCVSVFIKVERNWEKLFPILKIL